MRMSNAGRMAGIDGISQGIGLDVKPYALVGHHRRRVLARRPPTGDFDIGLDPFYNLTSALHANLTVNTDFAETEVDERIVNLTRFPVFFPEKREFFLDGANVFEFPGGTQSPFFSRRIGLTAGQPQTIDVGAKLTGQAGRLRHRRASGANEEEGIKRRGACSRSRARTSRWRASSGASASQSHVGMLYTRRATHESMVEPRHTAAADVTIATPDFIKGSTHQYRRVVHAHVDAGVRQRGRRPPGGGSQRFIRMARERIERPIRCGEVSFKEVQPAYNAAVGFTPRRNYPELESRGQLVAAVRGSPLAARRAARVSTPISTSISTTTSSIATSGSRRWSSNSTAATASSFRSSSRRRTWTKKTRNQRRHIVPEGSSYDWLRYQIGYDSAEQRMFSGRVEVLVRGLLGRQAAGVVARSQHNHRTGILIQLSSEFNDVELPGGAFTTKLYQLDARTQFSPWLSLSNNVQYDSESGEVGWQLRFRWIQKPGATTSSSSGREGREDEIGSGFGALDRRGVAKIVRTIRF